MLGSLCTSEDVFTYGSIVNRQCELPGHAVSAEMEEGHARRDEIVDSTKKFLIQEGSERF